MFSDKHFFETSLMEIEKSFSSLFTLFEQSISDFRDGLQICGNSLYKSKGLNFVEWNLDFLKKNNYNFEKFSDIFKKNNSYYYVPFYFKMFTKSKLSEKIHEIQQKEKDLEDSKAKDIESEVLSEVAASNEEGPAS